MADSSRILADVAAVLLGLAYGLCLVSGLRQAEQLASPDERGAVIACYYTLAYLGFAVPYLVDGLGAMSGRGRRVRPADGDHRRPRAVDDRVRDPFPPSGATGLGTGIREG